MLPPATFPPPGMAASIGPASSSPPKLPPSRPAPSPSLSSTFPPGRTPHPPRQFARLYADSLGRKYSGLKPDLAAQHANVANLSSSTTEQVYSTAEGPVVITTRGKLVFVAESFDLDVARKLTTLILDAQGSGELKMAKNNLPADPSTPNQDLVSQGFRPDTDWAESMGALDAAGKPLALKGHDFSRAVSPTREFPALAAEGSFSSTLQESLVFPQPL